MGWTKASLFSANPLQKEMRLQEVHIPSDTNQFNTLSHQRAFIYIDIKCALIQIYSIPGFWFWVKVSEGFLPSHALMACAQSTDPHGRFCWLLFNLHSPTPPFLLSNKTLSFSWVYCCPAERWHFPACLAAGYAMKCKGVRFLEILSERQRHICFFCFPSCCLDSGSDSRSLGSHPGLWGNMFKMAEEEPRRVWSLMAFCGCYTFQDCLPH